MTGKLRLRGRPWKDASIELGDIEWSSWRETEWENRSASPVFLGSTSRLEKDPSLQIARYQKRQRTQQGEEPEPRQLVLPMHGSNCLLSGQGFHGIGPAKRGDRQERNVMQVGRGAAGLQVTPDPVRVADTFRVPQGQRGSDLPGFLRKIRFS